MINNCIEYLLCTHPVWDAMDDTEVRAFLPFWAGCIVAKNKDYVPPFPCCEVWLWTSGHWKVNLWDRSWLSCEGWRALFFFTLLFLFCSFQKDWNANKKDGALVAILGDKVTLGMEDTCWGCWSRETEGSLRASWAAMPIQDYLFPVSFIQKARNAYLV